MYLGDISRAEIQRAEKKLKSGEAAGPDGIPAEALKLDPAISADILHSLLNDIWNQELVPADWGKGLIVQLPKKGNLSTRGNWRVIMLLSIPSKVTCKLTFAKKNHVQIKLQL